MGDGGKADKQPHGYSMTVPEGIVDDVAEDDDRKANPRQGWKIENQGANIQLYVFCVCLKSKGGILLDKIYSSQ